jgi:hypothetical protein
MPSGGSYGTTTVNPIFHPREHVSETTRDLLIHFAAAVKNISRRQLAAATPFAAEINRDRSAMALAVPRYVFAGFDSAIQASLAKHW